jgi:hypothetical protein
MSQEIEIPKVVGFAVYNPSTKLWSRGGVCPKWGKKPKIWPSIGHFKNHLAQHIHVEYDYDENYKIRPVFIRINHYYSGCVLIDVSTNQQTKNFDILDYLQKKAGDSYHKRSLPYKVINGKTVLSEISPGKVDP